LKSQEGELGKCHASDYSEIHRFAQFTKTVGVVAQPSAERRRYGARHMAQRPVGETQQAAIGAGKCGD
jgi:hypothetical protein